MSHGTKNNNSKKKSYFKLVRENVLFVEKTFGGWEMQLIIIFFKKSHFLAANGVAVRWAFFQSGSAYSIPTQ